MLAAIDVKTYRAIKDAVPEHAKRVVETRQPGSIYYSSQYVLDPKGRMVALHGEDGQYWGDVSLLKRA